MDRIQFENTLACFCQKNKSQWKEKNETDKDFCLIDGFALWPTSINEVARVGKIIEDKYSYKPLVIFNKKSYFQRAFYDMFKSYGINRFILLKTIQLSFINIIKTIGLFFIFLFSNYGINVLDYKLKNVEIGKIIYDSALAGKIKIKSFAYYRLLVVSFLTFEAYENLIKKYKIKYAVLADKEYITQGFLFHMLIKNKIPVIVSGTNRIKVYNSENENESFLHPGLSISEIIRKNNISSQEILEHIQKRMNGDFSQHDIQNAYKNKKKYTRNELCISLKLDETKPNVFIFPHVFSDCPHNSSYLLFDDYTDWFTNVMRTAENNRNINIIIKPHPSAYIYGEEDAVIRELRKHTSNNIFLCPADFNNASLKECSDLIVTCQGTIALEMACLGIPAIVAGAGYFNGYNIVKEFNSSDEYLDYLANVNTEIKNTRLTNIQQDNALQLYYYIYETSIIDKLYPNTIVHGNELKQESEYLQVMIGNFKSLNMNLENPDNVKFCNIIKDIC